MKKAAFLSVPSLLFATLLIVVGATRLLPHPPNFTAILAVSLMAGAMWGRSWITWLIPVVAMVVTDAVLGFHNLSGLVYVCLIPLVWSGARLSTQSWRDTLPWAGAGLAASIFFFLVTNLAVWWTSGIYPLTQEGLWTCFVMAIPFFHNMVLSTWLFSALLVVPMMLIQKREALEQI